MTRFDHVMNHDGSCTCGYRHPRRDDGIYDTLSRVLNQDQSQDVRCSAALREVADPETGEVRVEPDHIWS